ncbi:MAG TPA: lipoyl synthase, partial [candidate division WOR-3 bacterium]|nr:lipoyl synthase [candidate division WOR-3 bacterium]
LHTVCVEAKCPNLGQCWGEGTATFMILGDICTRYCKFCATKTGNPRGIVDKDEPRRVAIAVQEMDLDYVVITSVTRDDLPDGGASIFRQTIEEIRKIKPDVYIEVLVPDFGGVRENIKTVIEATPTVFAHNVEVVRRLTPLVRDRRASYEKSLSVLSIAKEFSSEILTKSGFMVGLGETFDEVIETMRDLRENGVDFLTIGQYLKPSPRHLEVDRYVTPEEFKVYEKIGLDMGFKYVASGPLVRSSYRAGEFFIKKYLQLNIKN